MPRWVLPMAYIATSSRPIPGPATNHGSWAGRRFISPLGYYATQQSQLGGGVPGQAGAADATDAQDRAAVQRHNAQPAAVQHEGTAFVEPAQADEVVQSLAGDEAQGAIGREVQYIGPGAGAVRVCAAPEERVKQGVRPSGRGFSPAGG